MKRLILLVLCLAVVLSSGYCYTANDFIKTTGYKVVADFGHGYMDFQVCNPTLTTNSIDTSMASYGLNVKGKFKSYSYNDTPIGLSASACKWVRLDVTYDMEFINNSASVSIDVIPQIKVGGITYNQTKLAWFNVSFTLAKQVDFLNTKANITNRILHYNFDTSNISIQSDCSDIKISNLNGTAAYPFYIESCNVSGITKIDLAFMNSCSINTNCSFNLYYKNSTPVSTSSNISFASGISDLNSYLSFTEVNTTRIESHSNLTGNYTSASTSNSISNGYWGNARNMSAQASSSFYATSPSFNATKNWTIISFQYRTDNTTSTLCDYGRLDGTNMMYAITNHPACGNNQILLGGEQTAPWDLCVPNFLKNAWEFQADQVSNDGLNSFRLFYNQTSIRASKSVLTNVMDGNSPFYIGRVDTTTTKSLSLFDEWQIYTSNLSASEIYFIYDTYNQSLYNIGLEQIINTPPVTSYYNLTPVYPFDNEELFSNITCIDNETSSLSGWVNWYKNGVYNTTNGGYNVSNNTNTIIDTYGPNHVAGDNWTTEFWCNDGLLNSTKQNLTRTIYPYFLVNADSPIGNYPPNNSYVYNTNSIWVNLSTSEDTASCWYWTNVSGVNTTVTQINNTNYANLTTFANGDYNFNAWCNNSVGRIEPIDAPYNFSVLYTVPPLPSNDTTGGSEVSYLMLDFDYITPGILMLVMLVFSAIGLYVVIRYI